MHDGWISDRSQRRRYAAGHGACLIYAWYTVKVVDNSCAEGAARKKVAAEEETLVRGEVVVDGEARLLSKSSRRRIRRRSNLRCSSQTRILSLIKSRTVV